MPLCFFACGFSWCYFFGTHLFLFKSVLKRTDATQLKSWWLHNPVCHCRVEKKIIASSKLQSKIKCVVSVIFAIFCSWKNTFCFGAVWQQLTEHSQWGFNSLYFNIKCLYICKCKHIAGNKHPSQPAVSSQVLIEFLHFQQRMQQIYNFVSRGR